VEKKIALPRPLAIVSDQGESGRHLFGIETPKAFCLRLKRRTGRTCIWA